MLSTVDQQYMRHAVRLSQRGIGCTGRNPAVGCVIVNGDTIAGVGYTGIDGRPHGEEIALQRAGRATKGATAYVTLEPCFHQSTRTEQPACAVQLVTAGVQRVVCLQQDADHRTAGQGLAYLRRHGVEVVLAEHTVATGNVGFNSRLQRKRPYIIIKIATSLDGKIALADGTSKWLTSPAARQAGQLLRARTDAMLIGRRTAAKDQPELTCRLPGLEQYSPDIFVIDGQRKLPAELFLNRATRWRRFVNNQSPEMQMATETDIPVPLLPLTSASTQATRAGLNLDAVLAWLAGEGYNTLLIEGGGDTIARFLQAGLADELHWFHASLIIGQDGRAGVGALALSDLTQQRYQVVKQQVFSPVDSQFSGDSLTILKR